MRLEETIIKILLKKDLMAENLRVSRRLKRAVIELSDLFTCGRAELSRNYFENELHCGAYLAAFTLTNAAKVSSLIDKQVELLPKTGSLSILDIGSGPGTAVFAASELLLNIRPRQEVRFVALETSRHMIDVAKGLGDKLLPPHHHVDWHVGDARSLKRIIKDSHVDLAIAANVFNEFASPDEQYALAKTILAVSGVCIIIDPALNQTTRDLMALRDLLVGNDVAHVVAPCTHQRPCPMLKANRRDWCHFYLEWNRPCLIEEIDRATGLDHRHLKMGYLVLKPGENRQLAAAGRPSRFFRVVSAPLKTKGKVEIVVCGNGKLKRLRRLDRNRSQENAAFDHVKRGDLISLSNRSFAIRLPSTPSGMW